MKSNENKKSLQPRLRFREFRDDEGWEEKELNELGSLVSGLTYSPDDVKESGLLVLRSSNIQNGAISLEDKVYVIPDVKGVNLSQPNDILICVRNGSKSLIGKNALIPEGLPICTHGAFMTVFRSKSWKFVFQLFQTKAYQKQVDGDLGATINSINGRHLMKYKFVVPSPEEQQKIADCLSSLDELIEAEDQKLEALQRHKKGLMQELFPAEGQTLPKRRFPEFQSAPEWNSLPIGTKVDFLSGYPFDGTDISENNQGIRLLRGINVTEGRIRHNQDIDRYYLGRIEKLEKYKIQTNDLLIPMDGSKVGKNSALVNVEDSGALLVQRVARLRTESEALIKFIYQHINSTTFHTYVDKINTSSGIPHISAKQICNFEICFPSPEEEQRIADFFSSIDDLITAQTKKLEFLRLHKKGLMQQLFPNASEVQE
jgi:type I restriction enzyme, S subunit